MSLTAHLLFRRETILPTGRIIEHSIDRKRIPLTAGQIEHANRISRKRAVNVEAVFNAIAKSPHPLSLLDIEIETTLARSTVMSALQELEAWPSGPRIIRHKGRKCDCHRFAAIKEAA